MDSLSFDAQTDQDTFRTGKFFEGEGPLVGWQVSYHPPSSISIGEPTTVSAVSSDIASPGSRQDGRGFLVVDAHQLSFGIRLEPQRLFTPKPSGALVATIRKLAPTSTIPFVLCKNRDFWIPLQKTRSVPPHLWVYLRWSSPPECHVVTADGISLVRKSQHGTYTKKKALEIPFPSWPPATDVYRVLGLLEYLGMATSPKLQALSPSAIPLVPDGPSLSSISFSPEQKEARDRVSRRLKTLKKSWSRYADPPPVGLETLERQAQALKTHFHRLAPLALVPEPVLEVEDPVGPLTITLKPFETPGQWLQSAFDQVRKMQKQIVMHSQERQNLQLSINALEKGLETLRSETLTPGQIAQILGPLNLSPKQKLINSISKPHAHKPYRVFKVPLEILPLKPPRIFLIHVGKSAADSDQLVKHARGNDLWLHAVGSTGSHVIIPAAPFSEGAKQGRADDPLIFAAAVLALYYSKSRDQKNQEESSGEVYFSRRQNIRKRKGMAPGLWQIDQAATLGIRYTKQDLERILNLMDPS